MSKRKLETHRKHLLQLAIRLGADISTLEEQTLQPTGGQAVGNLSNAPMHLGDMGTEVYLQELNATLLENEEFLRGEVMDALDRIDQGTYGSCENCGTKIIEERLELLPYARHCTPCAMELQSGRDVNLNRGRPGEEINAVETYNNRVEAATEGTDQFTKDISVDGDRVAGRSRRKAKEMDRHAIGTAGGGTAEGGLAGTNIGEGGPENADLQDAMATGTHDVAIAGEDNDTIAYSGPSGGAVGGTPAGKRAAVGHQRKRGIAPNDDPDRAESG